MRVPSREDASFNGVLVPKTVFLMGVMEGLSEVSSPGLCEREHPMKGQRSVSVVIHVHSTNSEHKYRSVESSEQATSHNPVVLTSETNQRGSS